MKIFEKINDMRLKHIINREKKFYLEHCKAHDNGQKCGVFVATALVHSKAYQKLGCQGCGSILSGLADAQEDCRCCGFYQK